MDVVSKAFGLHNTVRNPGFFDFLFFSTHNSEIWKRRISFETFRGLYLIGG